MQQIKIIQKRKSANNTALTNSPINHSFSLNYLLLTSNLRNYFNIKNYNFKVDSTTKINNQSVFVLTGTSKTEKITYYITEIDFKVIQLEFVWDYVLPRYRIDDYYFSISKTEGKLLFKEHGSVLFPLYTSNKLEINYYKNKSDTSIWHKQNIISELLYNYIITENVKEIDKNERLQIITYPDIYKLEMPYNQEFWETYTYLNESIDRKIIYDSINSLKK